MRVRRRRRLCGRDTASGGEAGRQAPRARAARAISRFIRAVAFVNTMVPVKNAAEAVNAASVMLNNFDIPKRLVREGASPEDFHLGYTQWSVIADMSHRIYYYCTMYDRRMRAVDLSKLDFGGKEVSSFPLDPVWVEDVLDRSNDFSHYRSASTVVAGLVPAIDALPRQKLAIARLFSIAAHSRSLESYRIAEFVDIGFLKT
jgi:hypothetical protein